jgi:hypothetical protein
LTPGGPEPHNVAALKKPQGECMSINFNDPMNEEAKLLIDEKFGDLLKARDNFTALVDAKIFDGQEMQEIANAAKQPLILELAGKGEIRHMSDGTRYQATKKGWVKLKNIVYPY